jgi:hypothetical protein
VRCRDLLVAGTRSDHGGLSSRGRVSLIGSQDRVDNHASSNEARRVRLLPGVPRRAKDAAMRRHGCSLTYRLSVAFATDSGPPPDGRC